MTKAKFFISAIALPIAITAGALLQQSLSVITLAQNIEDFPNNAVPVSPDNDIFNNPNAPNPDGGNPVNPNGGNAVNPNNIAITRGSGRITNSQYAAVVPVGTSVSQVSGAYNPSTGKILLEIEARQVEISLNAPLTDGTPIPFRVTGTKSRGYDPATKQIYGSQYSRLTTGGIKAGVQSQGTLIKQGNQIQGKFTAKGIWYVFGKSANAGSVDGEFTLNLQPGSPANTPVSRIISPLSPDEIDTSIPGIRGGW